MSKSTRSAPRRKPGDAATKRKQAFNAVYRWKEFAVATLEALIAGANDLRSEMAQPGSVLAGAMPAWALREFITGAGDAISGLSNLNVVGEVPVTVPDPLAGIYPGEVRDYSKPSEA